MEVLITGVNGFVGYHLKKYLLENNFEVCGTDISSDNNVDYEVDLLDKRKIEELIINVRPDFIFHLAAQSSVSLSWLKPELTMDVNVQGTKNLLKAVKSNIPNSRILIISSADVYGNPSKLPLTEKSELNPISPYGKSKLELEKLALSYGLNVVVSRTFTHTGPGQKPTFVCSDFAKQIVEIEKGKKPIIHTGNLDIRRDFTDVRDIVGAYLLALEKCNFNEIYNICSGKVYSIKNLLDILLSLSGIKVQIKIDSNKMREKDVLIMAGDNSKFIKATGWKPMIPIDQTLKDLLDYWRELL